MPPTTPIPLSLRPSWLPGLMLAFLGFAVWTVFSLWPWLMNSHAPFRIREAWDTDLFWHVGVPVMLLAQLAGGMLSDGRISWQPLGLLGGFFAGIMLVRPAGGDLGHVARRHDHDRRAGLCRPACGRSDRPDSRQAPRPLGKAGYTIACGRKRDVLPVIGFSSSRIDRPHGV